MLPHLHVSSSPPKAVCRSSSAEGEPSIGSADRFVLSAFYKFWFLLYCIEFGAADFQWDTVCNSLGALDAFKVCRHPNEGGWGFCLKYCSPSLPGPEALGYDRGSPFRARTWLRRPSQKSLARSWVDQGSWGGQTRILNPLRPPLAGFHLVIAVHVHKTTLAEFKASLWLVLVFGHSISSLY